MLVPGPMPARKMSREQAARATYRIISAAAGVLLLLGAADHFGLLSGIGEREPWYTIVVVGLFGVAFAAIGLAVVALVASFRLVADWQLALPAWLYTAAAAVVLVDLKLMEGQGNLWMLASALAGASLLAATWVGWFRKPPGHTS